MDGREERQRQRNYKEARYVREVQILAYPLALFRTNTIRDFVFSLLTQL